MQVRRNQCTMCSSQLRTLPSRPPQQALVRIPRADHLSDLRNTHVEYRGKKRHCNECSYSA
eukprot:scaffold54196_cov40-Prasinocladus_malaysianus.AAC.2